MPRSGSDRQPATGESRELGVEQAALDPTLGRSGDSEAKNCVSQVIAGRIWPALVIRPEFATQVWPTM